MIVIHCVSHTQLTDKSEMLAQKQWVGVGREGVGDGGWGEVDRTEQKTNEIG